MIKKNQKKTIKKPPSNQNKNLYGSDVVVLTAALLSIKVRSNLSETKEKIIIHINRISICMCRWVSKQFKLFYCFTIQQFLCNIMFFIFHDNTI